MKKKITSLIVALLWVGLSVAWANGSGPVHNITQNTYYATIQAAITAAAAGNVIEVAAGTYNEQVIIDKPISLIGANNQTTIIDGTGLTITQQGLIRIAGLTTGNVKVENFKIVNPPLMGDKHFAIQTTNCNEVVTIEILNNVIDGAGTGNDPNFTYALYSYGNQASLIFKNNIVKDFDRGNTILLELHLGSSEIAHNTITGTGTAGGTHIFVMSYKTGSNNNDVTKKQYIHNNTISATGTKQGIGFSSPLPGEGRTNGKFEHVVISDNIITTEDKQCIALNADTDGGFIPGSGQEIKISGNTLTNLSTTGTGSRGIVLAGGMENVVVENNAIANNYLGIDIMGPGGVWYNPPWPANTTIRNNTITGTSTPTTMGIRLLGGTVDAYNNSFAVSSWNILEQGTNVDRSFTATCNWWGSTTNFKISNPNNIVTYDPWLADDDIENPTCSGSLSNVINGTQGTNDNTIQGAVSAAALDDVIYIKGGTYTETVTDNTGVNFSPGASPGCVNIIGDFTVTPTTTFTMEIFGAVECTGYDQFDVSGTLTLSNSSLNIILNVYEPPVGSVFTLFKYGQLVGTFNNPLLIQVGNTYFVLNYGTGTSSAVTLTTVAPTFKLQINAAGGL
jgi:hypothetical protein